MNATPNRRGLFLGALTASAAASMAALPALAAEQSDPVFALLEAHKAAWARLLETEDRTDDYEALEEAGGAADAALEEITNTPPTTVAGMRAVMKYLHRSGRAHGLPAGVAAIVDPAVAGAGGLNPLSHGATRAAFRPPFLLAPMRSRFS
jgi:hypothetical protein